MMNGVKRTVMVAAGVAIVSILLFAISALAANQETDKPGRLERAKGMLQRVVLGEILSVSSSTVTVKPELPQDLIDRLAEHGVDAPALPASVVLMINDDSKLMLEGKSASLASFKKGDKIVAFCEASDNKESRVVLRMTDADSARQFMDRRREQMGQGMPGMGNGMNQGAPGQGMPGMGNGMGQGAMQDGAPGMRGGMGQGMMQGGMRQQMRPVFGKITAVSDSEVTIKVEIPAFVTERMAENGKELPENLPSEVTLKIGERTRFVVNGERVEAMPFKVGDEVAALGAKPGDEAMAVVISDLESAKQRLEEGLGGGPGMGEGPGMDGPGGPGMEGPEPGMGHGPEGEPPCEGE